MATKQTANGQKTIKRWSDAEDKLLLDTLRVYGHKGNHYCFLVVSEQIDRTPGAVSTHWYTTLSKKDNVWVKLCITETNVLKNRSQGLGVKPETSLWKRVLRIIKTLF